MRILLIAAAAALLMLPATAPAKACGTGMHSAQASTTELSAEEKSQ
jgi:hypothetical protein